MANEKTSNNFEVDLLVQPNVSTEDFQAALEHHFRGTSLPRGLNATVKEVGKQIAFKPGMPIQFAVQPTASKADFEAALKEHLSGTKLGTEPNKFTATVEKITQK